MSLLSLYQQKTTKNYINFLAKDLSNQYIGMNIKKSENKKSTNPYRCFSNKTLLELTD